MNYAYEVQGFYHEIYGWEAVFIASTIKEAKAVLADYQKNERRPERGNHRRVPFRIKKVKN